MSTFEGNDSSLVFSVETPIYSEQLALVESEIEEFRKNKNSRWERMFFRYYQCVTSGPYGSLVFNFDVAVLTLSDEEQKQIEETMNELMMATDWFSNWTSFYSIEQDLGGLSKEEIVNEKLIETYVENLIDCGYSVSAKNINEVFGEKLSEEEIVKYTLLNKFKNPEKWTD